MDRALASFSIDSNEHTLHDPNQFYHQQKEIDGVLSLAFNDLHNFSEDDLSDGELDSNQNYLVDKVKSSSTPLRIDTTEGNHPLNQPHVDDYAKLDSDCDRLTNLSLSDLDIYETKKFIDDHEKYNYQYKDFEFSKTINHNNHDVLQCQALREPSFIDQQLIEKLNDKIKLLEKQLKDQEVVKDDMCIKTAILESKVQTLEYELKETREIDFVARTSEKQAKAIESLRLKHHKELSDLRETYETKIEYLTQQLNAKEEERHDLIDKYKQEANRYQQTWNQTTADKVKDIVANAKKETELKLLHSFDQSVERIKQEWKIILYEDIRKIITWFEQDSNSKHTSSVNLEFNFKEILNLFTFLQKGICERENQISAKIRKFEEAKQQLERVLLESKQRNSSLSSSSSRSDRLDDLRNTGDWQAKEVKALSVEEQAYSLGQIKPKRDQELTDLLHQYEIVRHDLSEIQLKLSTKEEECQQLRHKVNKYKQHYIIAVKKHKEEVIQLKKEFSSIIQEKINTQKH